MRALVVAAIGLVVACKKPPDPANTGCHLAASPDRSAFVFALDHEIVLLRSGERRAVQFKQSACLANGQDIDLIVVSSDGWRAYVVGARPDSVGGFERAQWTTTVACDVDFRSGTAKPLDSEFLAALGLNEDVVNRGARLGSVSNRIYTWKISGGIDVFDPATKRLASITDSSSLWSAYRCELGEDSREAVLLCDTWMRRGKDDRVTLLLARVSLAPWPPAITVTEIAAPSQPTSGALSPDGSALAVWRNGPDGYLRIHDLLDTADFVVPERGGQVVNAVAFDRELVYVAVSIATESHTEWVRILDRSGGERGRVAIRKAPRALYAAGSQIVVDSGCTMERVEVPMWSR